MKPYKLKRRQEEHRKQNPSRSKRTQILVQFTKEIALEDFRKKHEPKRQFTWTWYPHARTDKDRFESELWYKAYEKYNFQIDEVEMMYPLYQRCLAKLEDEKKKAEYIKKKYVPLDSDLFHIV